MFQKEFKTICLQIQEFNRTTDYPITVEDLFPTQKDRKLFKWTLTIIIIAILWCQRENLSFTGSCLVKLPSTATSAFVPERNCDFCRNITMVERIRNLTPEEFTQRFAYSQVPVVIEDGTMNWTAPNVFSYEYFRSLYSNNSRGRGRLNCQFFPYKTEFHSLKEVFHMSKVRRTSRPWYVGWSNCDLDISNILRSHYSKPYFLPNDSESIRTDWIFMGTPGNGAHMHIDHVGRDSWQAQIRGTKVWHLEPPLECFTECHDLSTQVNSGNIIVLNTNVWYHRTVIVGNETSITIGAEYD